MEKKPSAQYQCGFYGFSVYGLTIHEMTQQELQLYAQTPQRAFVVRDNVWLDEAGEEIRSDERLTRRLDPHEGNRRFFERLPAHYLLHPGERVELFWAHQGEYIWTGSECFAGLEQASEKALALGPAYDITVQVVEEAATTPGDTGSEQQLLAHWRYDVFEKHRSNDVVLLQPLPSDEPSLMLSEYFSGAYITCEARWFYHRSRCPIRDQIQESRRRRQDGGEAEKEESSTFLEKLTERG